MILGDFAHVICYCILIINLHSLGKELQGTRALVERRSEGPADLFGFVHWSFEPGHQGRVEMEEQLSRK